MDWLSFPTPPTSLTVSATGEFLATSHVGQVGISLWCDKSFFQTVFLDGQIMEEPAYMDSPSPIAESMDVSISISIRFCFKLFFYVYK